jgi:hypothetical protein
MTKVPPAELLEKLRRAREIYENEKYGARPKLRKGLENRWNKALVDAKSFSVVKPQEVDKPPAADATGAAAVGAGTAGAGIVGSIIVNRDGVITTGDIVIILSILFGSLLFGVVILSAIRSRKRKVP